MQKDTDILGAWDEAELVELSEADVHGGTGPVCAAIGVVTAVTGVAVGVSAAVCPTTKCTSRC
ncbi:class II lanthipeptide, LchA2/BrtA2 family [Streptomyces sp. FXJ1.4098]|uniref:class II lanthipeptide, LchA2/BrtA2 family n=1 Tax=Streptomyces sp. NPDC020845 TaxID=3365096 RepID=UPI002991E266|nr:class II lanthipeptide, LchA2/BrtA2 family [Streptomyces sp. FXJ1.4098]